MFSTLPKTNINFWGYIYCVICKYFEFGQVQNFAVWERVNSLPNNRISDLSKFKSFADDKLKVIQIVKFVLDKIEDIVGKKENAGYQHFSFPTMFLKGPFFKVAKSWDCMIRSLKKNYTRVLKRSFSL